MTTSGQDGSRGDPSVGRPGLRWGADDPDSLPPDQASDKPSVPAVSDASADASLERRRTEAGRDKPSRVQPEDATIGRRIGAWFIDELARTLFYPLLLIVLVMFGGQIPDPVAPGELNVTAVLPQIVLRAGLSWIFWSQGTSPGAMLLHLRLVDAHGNAPGPVRGGIRAMVEILSIMTMLIGFAWALFSRRQTWHDLASGVYVVNAPREDRED